MTSNSVDTRNIKDAYLTELNPAQLTAVTNTAKSLQVLAGPGSGKTKVLTSRVAWLIEKQGLNPCNVVVVTFTNKAASEMRSRLSSDKLLGQEITDYVVMGTFHSICARYLRKHGGYIKLNSNFVIADASESKNILKKILKELNIFERKVEVYMSEISKAKCNNMSPEAIKEKYPFKSDVACVYKAYESKLRENNSLDFDDLLVFALKLFRTEKNILKGVEHVLVDEFQDTNSIQYELVKLFAKASKCLTVVGDPDQSIYLWRSADVANFKKMCKDFSGTEIVRLEQNYRSTASILECAIHVVSKDTDRIAKGLWTSNMRGVLVSVCTTQDQEMEAQLIAQEIARLTHETRQMLHYSDFAVLVRVNVLTRAVEAALQGSGIPYNVVGAYKFFDRMEIKDIIAYLRLVENDRDTLAFERIINVPKREIGPKTIDAILRIATEHQLSPIEVVKNLVAGKSTAEFKRLPKKGLTDFLKTIVTLKQAIDKNVSIPALIYLILEKMGYEEHLRKNYQDADARVENVLELISFATRFECTSSTGGDPSGEVENGPIENSVDSPLSTFLTSASLASDIEYSDERQKNAVTIATLHASKGLEWPCVFVIGCEDGLIPHTRSQNSVAEKNEERRLLYVGMTRAKCFLYCTNSLLRTTGGYNGERMLSPFLRDLPQASFSTVLPELDTEMRRQLAVLLGRPVPSESEPLEEKTWKDLLYHKPAEDDLNYSDEDGKHASNGEDDSDNFWSLQPRYAGNWYSAYGDAMFKKRQSSEKRYGGSTSENPRFGAWKRPRTTMDEFRDGMGPYSRLKHNHLHRNTVSNNLPSSANGFRSAASLLRVSVTSDGLSQEAAILVEDDEESDYRSYLGVESSQKSVSSNSSSMLDSNRESSTYMSGFSPASLLLRTSSVGENSSTEEGRKDAIMSNSKRASRSKRPADKGNDSLSRFGFTKEKGPKN
ncbi:uncharacterized protein VTP21DRAFT_11142 [Calcarisporiella thermophila]|uniref:uncharacterized protein n=1 Tax=Calcarisporiella thermophila TaxID=911321 RepID=UPI003743B30E